MKKNWTLLLIFMLAISFTMAQERQLKTFHFCYPGGREYPADKLSWTGYEDELGNITRHGLYTHKTNNASYSLNFKHGELDGLGKIITPSLVITPHGLTINLKYDNGKLISINSFYIDSKTQKKIENFKYTLNEEGFLVGNFLFRDDDIDGLKLLTGQFDEFGRATGWWSINSGEVKDKVYFEQGYCLGGDEKTIEISRNYLIDHKISEKELHDNGYYVLVNAMPVREQSLKNAIGMLATVIETFGKTEYKQDYTGYVYEGLCMSLHLSEAFNIDSKNIFKIFSLGQTEPLTFMSAELYQNITTQIKNKALQVPLKYDVRIDKYYVLKADGESRLYIPIEFENDFKVIVDDNHKSCGIITDYDGNVYQTVQIGSQCWMKENLRSAHYSDGTEIELASLIWGQDDEWYADDKEKLIYIPDANSKNISNYGYLYNWAAVMNGKTSSNSTPSNIQGVCPTGWHIPSMAEWDQLIEYISSINEYRCNDSSKYNANAMSLSAWENSDYPCTPGYNKRINNASGFSAIPAGWYQRSGKLSAKLINAGYNTGFWSSGEEKNKIIHLGYGETVREDVVFGFFLTYQKREMFKQSLNKCSSLSVRCIKD